MATRIFLPSTGTAAITNATFDTWTETTGADRVAAVTSKISSAMTNKTQARTASAANNTWLDRQYIIGPLAGQTYAASTIKGTIRALESAVNDNVDAMRLSVRVVAPNGTTFRGTIYGPTNSTVAEFNTTLRAKRLATGGATTQVVITEGDYLVIEIGATATTGGTSISTSINYGDNSATDLGDNETDTAANNPFVELAGNMKFLQFGYGQAQADIKVTQQNFGQPQADIKAQGRGFGQANVLVNIHWRMAQAQTRIASKYELLVRKLGPASYWKLDEPVGSTTIGDQMGAVSGTVEGSPTFGVTADTGLTDSTSMSFSDDSQRITFGDNYDMTGTTAFMVVLWVKHTGSFVGSEYVLSKGTGTTGWYIYSVTGQIRLAREGAAVSASSNLVADTWSMVAVGYSGTQYSVQIDDVTGILNTSSSSVSNVTDSLKLAVQSSTDSSGWRGVIDEVSLFNKFLNYDDIQALYTVGKSGAIGRPGQAQAYIKLNAGRGQATVLINGTYTTVLDTFARSVTDGMGTSDTAGDWTAEQDAGTDFDVNGSSLTVTVDNSSQRVQRLSQAFVGLKGRKGIEVRFDFSVNPLPATGGINFHVSAGRSVTDIFSANTFSFDSALDTRINISTTQITHLLYMESVPASSTVVSYTAGDIYTSVVQFIPTSNGQIFTRKKFWKIGDIEPGFFDNLFNNINGSHIGHVALGTSQGAVTGSPIAILDNLQIQDAWITRAGQAQAKITNGNFASGQAQAGIIPYIFISGAEDNTVSGHWTIVTGTPTVENTIVKSGAHSFKFTGASNTFLEKLWQGGTIQVGRGSFRIDTAFTSSSRTTILALDGPSVEGLLKVDSSGNLYAQNGVETLLLQLSLGRWYRVDWRWDVSGTTYTLDIKIDGTEYGPITRSSLSPGTTGYAAFGNFTSADATMVVYWDDVVLSKNTADYPIGDGFVYLNNIELFNAATYRSAQAQADIKSTNRGFGQALALLPPTTFGQAQARISKSAGYGQAHVIIDTGIHSASDAFGRSVSDSLGTADVGGNYSLVIGTGTQWDVDGSKAVFTASTVSQTQQSLNSVYLGGMAEYIIDIVRSSSGAATGTTTLQLGPYSSGFTMSGSEFDIDETNGSITHFARLVSVTSNTALSTTTLTVGTTYRFKIHLNLSDVIRNGSALLRFKLWDIGGTEPGWTERELTLGASIPNLGIPTIRVTAGNSTIVYTFDNLSVSQIGWTQYAQAQADIKAKGNGLGQSNADIKAKGNGLGQAQTQISGFYQKNILHDGPIAYWRLGDTAGTAVPDYAGGYVGQYVGTLTYGDTSPILGDSTGSIRFGSGGYINVPSLAIPTPAYTLEVWVNTRGLATSNHGLMGRSSFGPTLGVDLTLINGPDDVRLYNSSTGFTDTLDANNIPGLATDSWHHIVGTFDGTNARIYADGILYAGPTAHHVPDVGANTFKIAQYGSPSGTDYPGSLDEAAVYNIALTPEQVFSHYTVATLGSLIRSGQAQADIKAKGNGLGQAQADIKAISFGLAQAQSDIKAKGNGLAQAQADIKAVGFGLGQAQGDIKTTSFGLGQTQADIKATGFGLGQSQSDVKAVGFGLGQAQSDIKATGFGLGQSQADIKKVGNGLGQAQGDIKATSFGLGQAQSNIKATSNGFGQAQSDIKQTYTQSAQAQADIKAIGYGEAQAQADIKQTYSQCAQAQADIKATRNGFGQAQCTVTGDAFGQSQTDIRATYWGSGQAQSDIKATYVGCGQANATIKGAIQQFAQAQTSILTAGIGSGNTQTDIKQTYTTYGQSQADILHTYYGSGQCQATIVGNAFGQSQTDIKHTYTTYAQTQGYIQTIGYGSGQSQADIRTQGYGTGQAQTDVKAMSTGSGQSQADIKSTNNGYGQAQSDIKATSNGSGQANADIKQTSTDSANAQADIKVTSSGSGQCQADIKTTYTQNAQAQADIKQTYYQSGQSQADIKVTFTQFGQANTDIKSTGQGYGQSQTDVKATSTGSGQANSDIKATEYGNGQAQSDIKVTQYGSGQAQTDVVTTYQDYAQAQADIKSTSNGSGQSQTDVKVTYQQYGQAQGYLRAFGQNVYGQAQTSIRFTGTIGAGQAQAKLNAFDQVVCGQTQADIKTTQTGSGQSQADIKVTEYGNGNAQTDIKVTSTGSGQAQSDIKQTYTASGQTQCDIRTTGYGSGQSQADIKVTTTVYAQSQADIKSVGYGSGQAQTNVQSSRSGSGQATTDVKATNNNFGQANSDIKVTQNAFGQAQGSISTATYGSGQSQGYITAQSRIYGQTQTDVKQIYNQSAQSQADIQVTTSNSANAQSTIKISVNNYGQSAAIVRNTYSQFGQTQATIQSIKAGYGLANALIQTTVIASGLAQATIIKPAGYGQALARVVTIYLLKRMTMNDYSPLTLTMLDKEVVDTEQTNNVGISLTLSDRNF